jgi:hypothetical protein
MSNSELSLKLGDLGIRTVNDKNDILVSNGIQEIVFSYQEMLQIIEMMDSFEILLTSQIY